MSNASGLVGQEDAVDFSEANYDSEDTGNRFYYENSEDWVLLYGCHNCLETFEFEKKICQEGLEQVYQYAIDYTDFYTLEVTTTITNAEAATGMVNGWCL